MKIMKKKTKRFLFIILFLVLPATAISGYIVYSQFKGSLFYKVTTLYQNVKTKGLKALLFSSRTEGENTTAEASNESSLEDRVPVVVFKAFITGFKDTLPALGTLKGYRDTKLGFEKAGIIKTFTYKEGDLIPKGSLICELDKEETLIRLKGAESKLQEAQSNLLLAENKLQRAAQKFEIGGTSKSVYEEALLEYERDTHTVEIGKAEVENAKLELKKCDIFAPYEGLLGNKYVETGETITPNTLVCDLIDVEYMIVQIGVVERDIEKVALKQKASVYVDAYPDREFLGKVENISPVVEGQSRTFSIELKVANPQKLLMPGMFARVKINVFEKDKALVIPASAVIQFRKKTYVFVVNEETGIVKERPVAVLYSSTDYSIIERGLKEGELVVSGDHQSLADGTPVKIVERQVPET